MLLFFYPFLLHLKLEGPTQVPGVKGLLVFGISRLPIIDCCGVLRSIGLDCILLDGWMLMVGWIVGVGRL